MPDTIPATLAPRGSAPVVAFAAPVATAADIRAGIEILTSEAEACETLVQRPGDYSDTQAGHARRCIALLRACLHRVEG